MKVALCFDENYAPYACVTICSVLKSACRPSDYTIFLMPDAVSDSVLMKMTRFIESFGAAAEVLESTKDWSSFSATLHLSRATYMRLELPDRISGKFIYLDCDIIVLKDLMGMMKEVLAAPIHAAGLTETKDIRYQFNAGVMVIDSQLWKAKDITGKSLDYYSKNPEKCWLSDQTMLNAVIRSDEWIELNQRWNVRAVYFDYGHRDMNLPLNEYRDIKTHPYVIHFTDRRKPWLRGCTHPCRDIFWRFAELVPFSIQYPKSDWKLIFRSKIRQCIFKCIRLVPKKTRRDLADKWRAVR